MSITEEAQAPRKTTDLIGHEAAERALLESWNSGRMPHAWLLTGRKGIGKATLAYRTARFVLSQGAQQGAGLFGDAPMTADSLSTDPESPVSLQVGAGGHPDLLTIERSINTNTKKLRGEIVVEDVRRLTSFLSLTAAAGEWRVVIVDTADEMNRNAANALLKGLEEPPSNTLFLLVCNAPGRLLPTIRSRCRMLAMKALPDATVVDVRGERIGGGGLCRPAAGDLYHAPGSGAGHVVEMVRHRAPHGLGRVVAQDLEQFDPDARVIDQGLHLRAPGEPGSGALRREPADILVIVLGHKGHASNPSTPDSATETTTATAVG